MQGMIVHHSQAVEMTALIPSHAENKDLQTLGARMQLMPGRLTPEQMDALRTAEGPEFDKLFLLGMIHHHNGAPVMVKSLFDTPGAGQDADAFNFATDVDCGQRAEIRIMQSMLD
jgi:uncharacterized protein (DUF305 family)